MVVGLTGGIGSGKTTILNYFKSLGVPVYIADQEAKALMNSSTEIKQQLICLFGDEAYKEGVLNRAFLSAKIFNDKVLLQKMNAIVHPKVAAHFKTWLQQQEAPYVIKEAAIIFENNHQDQYDYIITVIADEDLRIQRVMARNGATEDNVKSIIKNQWSDADKVKASDFVIVNNSLKEAKDKAFQIHNSLLKKLNP